MEQICKRFGISRSSLYRLFEKDGGFRNWVTDRRLDAIREHLNDPANAQVRVGTLAHMYGFSSDSTLSRAFRTRFGMSPRDARRGNDNRNNGIKTTANNPNLARFAEQIKADSTI